MLLRSSRRKGLTLLEVLVALGTFLLSLIGLVFLLNVAGNLALDAQQKSTALQMAQTKLAEVAAGAVPLEAQNDQSFE
ncbi:MAG: prepilin-type N-terminal cleavage/methylation domain-containing protein, partial [Gemmataceae bacterium]